MRRSILLLGIIAMYLMSLSGCGGGTGGAPGSSGEEDTGIIISSVQATATSGAPEAGTGHEVDVAIHACDAEATTFEDGLYRHQATLMIGAAKINPNVTATPFPASVEQCIITYKKANEDPAAPIIESLTIYPNCTLLENDDAAPNECIITLMDIERKIRWWDTVFATAYPAEYPTHYIAEVRCTYMNNFGEAGTFQVEYDVWLADWNNC